jgi:hypothetical protein
MILWQPYHWMHTSCQLTFICIAIIKHVREIVDFFEQLFCNEIHMNWSLSRLFKKWCTLYNPSSPKCPSMATLLCFFCLRGSLYANWIYVHKTLRATPPMLSMWPCKLKFYYEKSKHAGLGKQNGFGAAFLHSLLRLVKGTAKLNNTCQRSVTNMIWLLLLVSDQPIIVIGQGGLLLVVSHLFVVPVLVS